MLIMVILYSVEKKGKATVSEYLPFISFQEKNDTCPKHPHQLFHVIITHYIDQIVT